jgi:hypothetical protein
MKFTLIKDLRGDALMRPLLGGLLAFVLLFLIFDVIQKHEMIGLSPAAAAATLYGDEETFTEAITFTGLLEVIHGDTFFAMMSLLTLSAVYARLVDSTRKRLFFINTAMLGAFFSLLSLLGAFYFGTPFLYGWITLFFLWHLSAFGMTAESLWRLYRP